MRRLRFISTLVCALLLASSGAVAGAVVRTTSPALAGSAGSTTTAVPTAGASVRLPPDGSFVRARNRVWRLVGGALVYVPSWAPYGGVHRTVALTSAQYSAVSRSRIRDGELINTLQDHAVYRMVGGAPIYVSSWTAVGGVQPTIGIDAANLRHAGEGFPWGAITAFPVLRLTDRGFRPSFVRSGSDGRVYALVGGAPLYVTSWAVYGGRQPTVTIDAAAITHAGRGRWRFLRWYPVLSTPNEQLAARARPGAPTHSFAVAGGAPVYVPSTNNFPEPVDQIVVDPTTVTRAGGRAPFDHLRARPADGTFLLAFHDADVQTLDFPTTVYWVRGGAAIPVVGNRPCSGGEPAWIDRIAVDKAGTGGVWNHLAKPPVPAPTPPC
ncbi:MAG: hypothetical protein ABIV05_10515 [Actinomycetota bacterium]